MGVLNQLLSIRCSVPFSSFPWPSPWSCSSRCRPPLAPLPSLLSLAPPPSSPSLPPRLLPLLQSPSWASKPSSLQPTCSLREALAGEAPGEARGLLRRRRSLPSRLLLPLRLRTATRG